jgi:hypothetical protein
MKRVLLLGLAAMSATSATAQTKQLKSMNLALELGSVLAAEEACGLTYDQSAIERFIDKNVPADDMSFPSSLSMMTSGSAVQLEEMTASAKTAHCSQIRRIAKSYGFIGG